MEFTGRLIQVKQVNGIADISFSINERMSILPDLEKIRDCEKLKITAVKYREKRSRDANAYLWVLLQKMAESLYSDKWSIYLQMLKKYGQFTYIVVKPGAVEAVKKQWRECEEVGRVVFNGKDAVQMLCYYGSSTYDTREMGVLIDGIVSECQELGIDTVSPEELRQIKERWGI